MGSREQSSLLFWRGGHCLGMCPLGGDSSLTFVLQLKAQSAKHYNGHEKGKHGSFGLKIAFLWKSVLNNPDITFRVKIESYHFEDVLIKVLSIKQSWGTLKLKAILETIPMIIRSALFCKWSEPKISIHLPKILVLDSERARIRFYNTL